MPRRVFDMAGREVSLGHEIGRGGEGAVFEVNSNPSVVAKIYHRELAGEKGWKLRAMARLSNSALTQISAWPVSTLTTNAYGPISGFLMPKVTGYKEIHKLYGPSHRKNDFPHADWSFLIHAARNLASAVETFHSFHHIVGDINQKNICVSRDATIKFVDCDSFQITYSGKTYPCEVGVPLFTPPELHSESFRGVVRSINHDYFGLAIIVFHLLFMGRHPFSGKYSAPEDIPIERAIREYRFAYGKNANAKQMSPPPQSLTLYAIPPALATMFERSFSEDAAHSGNRPTASEWMRGLEDLKRNLRTCTRLGAHKYYGQLPSCPWCELESRSGVFFFIQITVPPIAGLFDPNIVWERIKAIPNPGPSRQINFDFSNQVRAQPLPEEARLSDLSAIERVINWFTGEGAKRKQALNLERQKRSTILGNLERQWSAMKSVWETEASPRSFDNKMNEMERTKKEYIELLTVEYPRARKDLEDKRRESQLHAFLLHFFIDVPGIGPGLKATLASYGIETADDISSAAVSAVPGFGPQRTQTLLEWRRSCEARFRYDPARGVNPADIAALDQKYITKRRDLERILSSGSSDLETIRNAILQNRNRLWPLLEQLARLVAQAKADLSACR